MISKPADGSLTRAQHGIRPMVARRASSLGPWIFGTVALIAGSALFASLDANRRQITAPATRPSITDLGSGPSRIPELQLPLGYGAAPAVLPPEAMLPVSPASPPVQEAQSTPRLRMPDAVGPPSGSLPGNGTLATPAAPSPAGNAGVVFDSAPPQQAGDTREHKGQEESSVTRGPERVTAGRLSNPADTIIQGSIIQAVLETALDSTRPGLARAIVSREVRGFDGSRVLVPRGSRLVGEYQSDVSAGQNRALVVWTRLVRPDGVTINLQSPAADALGRAGIKGKVNSHFFARFGGAILQSALDVGVGLATRNISGGTVIVGLPGSTTALPRVDPNATADVKPTVTVRQGASVSVFVARDLDFSSVGGAQ